MHLYIDILVYMYRYFIIYVYMLYILYIYIYLFITHCLCYQNAHTMHRLPRMPEPLCKKLYIPIGSIAPLCSFLSNSNLHTKC